MKGSPLVGDLLEEYREVMQPSRGRVRATLWVGGQLASLVRPWMWGPIIAAFVMIVRWFVGLITGPSREERLKAFRVEEAADGFPGYFPGTLMLGAASGASGAGLGRIQRKKWREGDEHGSSRF
jgi:hypothetical protein